MENTSNIGENDTNCLLRHASKRPVPRLISSTCTNGEFKRKEGLGDIPGDVKEGGDTSKRKESEGCKPEREIRSMVT